MAKRTTVGSGGHAKTHGKLSGAELYRLRRKAIAPLVSFELPKPGRESKHARDKARKYFKYLISDGRQPGIAVGIKAKVRRKNEETLRSLQRDLGQGRLKGVKYAFIPSVVNQQTGLVEQATLKSRCGDLPVVTVGNVNTVTVPFDIKGLLRNPYEEVRLTMALLMRCAKNAKVARFRIATGEFGQTRMYASLLEREVVQEVINIMSAYTTSDHNWQKWVYGLAVEFTNSQRDMQEREISFNMRKEAMKEVRKIRTDFADILEVVSEYGPNVTGRTIASKYAGRADDTITAGLLKAMHKQGMLNEHNDKWSLSKNGRDYLKKWQAIQKKIRSL